VAQSMRNKMIMHSLSPSNDTNDPSLRC
jgi:hypothetical protein